MAVSDSYVVQYLLQTTLSSDAASVWEEKESGYRTTVRAVSVDLDIVPSRVGDRIFLTLSSGNQRAYIAEPLDFGVLNPKYESEDQRYLASLLRELVRAVAQDCASRQPAAGEPGEEQRQEIFRQLLFGEPDATEARRS